MMPFCAVHSDENLSCVRLGSTVDELIVGLSDARFEQVVAGDGVSSFTSGVEVESPLEHAVVRHKSPPIAAVRRAWLAEKEEASEADIGRKPSTFSVERNCTARARRDDRRPLPRLNLVTRL